MRATAAFCLMALAISLGACAGSTDGTSRANSYQSGASDADGRANRPIPASVAASALAEAGVSNATVGAGGVGPSGEYAVGPYDVLAVNVFNVPELTGDFQVSPGGRISLPLVGEVQASGRSVEQIRLELATTLGRKYLQSPQVTVTVKDYKSQRVTVEGAVAKPGVFDMKGSTSLLQAIAMAEGATRYAEPENVLVFRQVGSQRQAARFDINQIRSGKVEDPTLKAGDVVVVAESSAKAGVRDLIQFLPLAGAFALLL
ncbi:MAG TPA: polysaccharide biosynthesis/export family protein [Xanthobacteraceae bacterium]|nr:polysaccharide biosynthesis/export family protein [Xanthobacteraceae bacterium]